MVEDPADAADDGCVGQRKCTDLENLAVQAADAAALTTDTVEKTAQESVPFYHGMINLNTFFR